MSPLIILFLNIPKLPAEILPEILAFPITSNGYAGVLVPIPIFELYTFENDWLEDTPLKPVTVPVTVRFDSVVWPDAVIVPTVMLGVPTRFDAVAAFPVSGPVNMDAYTVPELDRVPILE